MQIAELGEFGLIERIRRLQPHLPENVVEGIGDDVAVLKMTGPEYLLATCDTQVENVHFTRRGITPFQLGRRVVAINVSDVAAMGGFPQWALVSLTLTGEVEVEFVEELYRGMREGLQNAGAALVGGNLSCIEKGMVIDLCLLGKVPPDALVLRKGAQIGDMILVTGFLGDSRAGLELIRHPEWAVSADSAAQVKARHLTPEPRLREGQELGRCGWVRAMVDVSDGLLSDIGHICQRSAVGAELWMGSLPISSACREVAQTAGVDPRQWALTGGEDFELLFTAMPQAVGDIQRLIQDRTGTFPHVIGRIVEMSQGVRVIPEDGSSTRVPVGLTGWDHFRSR